MATYPRRTVTRTIQRTPEPGPKTGGLVVMNFTYGQTQLADTTVLDWEAPFNCRIMAVTHTCSAQSNSSTIEVSTTTGAVLAGSAVSDAGVQADISGATSANRDVAAGEQITITWTDVSTDTCDDLVVTIVLWVQGFPQTDGSTDNEAND